jgi:TonB-dependent receptor
VSKTFKPALRPDRIGYAVSMALALWGSEAALAQTSPPETPRAEAPAAKPPAKEGAKANDKPAEQAESDAKAALKKNPDATDLGTVLVVGTRQSQQSSIDRKKRAATATDSVVAEDVGAFPDRNIGEAISRIAGVALDRGDFGEGVSVSVRGTGADLTRVELDGQAVQAGGGTDLLGGGGGRGVEFRELSSDLIKSVDVVKGSTAAMTEGSLGGSIQIQTRTGLDFKKPYYSLRIASSESSLNKKSTPNLNLVLADKFLDKRLGVLLNLNKSNYNSESHQLTNGGVNNLQGLTRLADFDNSPEKTFAFNPSTVSKTDAAATTTLLASPLTGGGTFNAATPLELVTKSAQAQTKADCFSLFPNLSTAQINAISGSSNRTLAINQRNNEQLTCLNQWNDYSPALIRSYVRGQDDKRVGGDLRLDFKVNDNLSIYGKYANNKRKVADVVGNFSVGGTPTVNAAGTFTDSASGVRSVTSGLTYPYYLLPGTYSYRAGSPLASGATVNIKPGYTVDDSHHLTSYTTTDNYYNTDMIFSRIQTDSQYLQAGGEYRNGRFQAKFMGGTAKSSAFRYDRRASFGYQYGEGTFTLQPDGSWAFTLPAGSTNDQLNYDKYAQLYNQAATAAVPVSATNTVAVPAYTAAQKPLVTSTTNVLVSRVFKSETSEKTGKLDLSYDLREKLPFLNSLQGGLNLRETGGKFWGLGGATIQEPSGTFGTASYVPGIYLPTTNVRSSIVGCENTAGSLGAGGQPCAYGFNPSTNPATPQNGQTVLTQAQYRDLVRQVLSVAPAGQFYAGASNRSPSLIDGWNQIDIDKLFSLAGIPLNLDCVVTCKASDGKIYDQPVSRFNEKSHAAYVMTDFEFDRIPFTNRALPFGMELAGNIGVRMVKTDVTGTGYMTFVSVKKTASYNPLDPNAAGGTTTNTYRKNTSITSNTTDVMPSLNLALWVVPDKTVLRYNLAKTIARPGYTYLLPSGTCTYDERRLDEPDDADGSAADQRCSGTMGNPGLKPQTNVNQNLALEWYANRDTMLTAAVFKHKGLIGAPTLVSPRTGVRVFEGTDTIDPGTGKALSELEFSFNQWNNQKPSTRRGLELGMKTAFTFLPSVLKFTGLDANYTRVRSTQNVPTRDLITGDEQPIVGEPKYSYNASLWYDDGGFSARLALQVVAPRYLCYSPCGSGSTLNVNNYPSDGTTNWRLPYNVGVPIYSARTRFLDAKMAYKFKNGVEIFIEGRNLTGERTQTNTGGYEAYSGGIPSVYSDAYTGRRVMFGINIRSLQ